MAASTPSRAEVEKFAVPCETGMCFHWWPKLPPLPGWHHDRDHSLHYSVNALAPEGTTFAEAETVIYAQALYKPRSPDVTSVEALIQADLEDFRSATPDLLIAESESLTTADGQVLRTFTFFPKAEGNWERVAYGEEGDYFLQFTVSSRSQGGYREGVAALEKLIRSYSEHLTAKADP